MRCARGSRGAGTWRRGALRICVAFSAAYRYGLWALRESSGKARSPTGTVAHGMATGRVGTAGHDACAGVLWGMLRMRSAQCVVDYCAERIRRCAPVGFGYSDFVQQLQACRHRTTAVEYTHARMHGAAAAVCANAFGFRAPKRRCMRCREPRTTLLCCKPTARHDGTQPAGAIRQAHAASARQRAESCATASRAHACVCAPAGAWCQSKAQHSQGGQAAQGCAVPGGTRGELRLIKFVAVRCNRMRYNASHQAVQVGPGADVGESRSRQRPVSAGADVATLQPEYTGRERHGCRPAGY
jgi:hypothetical protein